MVSTFTPNINLEEPARGDQVGTWDTPVNANMSVIDLVSGGITVIGLNNSPVVLASAQYQVSTIVFNSTLTGNVTITFPTSFKKSYNVINLCTGSSAFIVTLQTTAAAGQAACAPPGDVQVLNSGANILYLNLGRVGSYLDYGGSSVPAWISGCTVPPYLNCDGSTFSAATYPALAVILGSTTLPASLGRYRATLNQGTGQITTALGGVDGNTRGATGGAQSITLATSNLPAYTPSGTINSCTVGQYSNAGAGGGTVNTYWPALIGTQGSTGLITTSSFTGAAQGGVSQVMTNLPPTYMGGLTLIRSA